MFDSNNNPLSELLNRMRSARDQHEEPTLPVQPYLITVANNPAYTGEIPDDESFAEPCVIEASSVFLLAGKKDDEDDYVGIHSLQWCISAWAIANMLAQAKNAEHFLPHAMSMLNMKNAMESGDISTMLDAMLGGTHGFPGCGDGDDYIPEG